MWNEIIPHMLQSMIESTTPEFRQLLVNFIHALDDKAKQTKSPVDATLIIILKVALGIK